mmetsp:Transcript_26396/g.73783  ORF Transcript_26396/g.73783 Transcript_26396/m.73783 type:complete len:146 (+) Transcript_26396:80-517(+)|eukprot:CAMPEP_0119131566 /NCGR_PEP_ID=MMETSP1310-20130426/10459_1 /TAXON_ID=464262 /ORGANISM="Genus nov. species nov., Strain RCC2339" /LENGTH=145 /DNA_ID=CAMNT_0007122149 /DNA_START=57 /DNA_END=491 /DNA_ORIENTATION=+
MQDVQQQQIIAQYQAMRNEIQSVAQKITEFEGELHEHELVIKTLEKVDPKRRCYRQVGDALVERTVAEVLPAVIKNRDGIKQVSEKLAADLQEKQKAEQEFAKKYKIEFKTPEALAEERANQAKQAAQNEQAAGGGGGSSAGVLV